MEQRVADKSDRKKRRARPYAPRRPFVQPSAAGTPEEAEPGKDYTPEILEFLRNAHGSVRTDGIGEYYYEHVSTISLHFLLRSRIPAKELLWRWYRHFEQERSETIYQTLPPLRDEEFLDILSACSFHWNVEAVKESGLVFLSQHRAEVYLALEEILAMRLDAFETMDDGELAEVLTPQGTWSDKHLQKLVRNIQTQPLSQNQRQSVYEQLESDYLKATARHLIDEALGGGFWKSPPPELEGLHSRFIIFARTMTNTARRLGVYASRNAFEEQEGRGFRQWPRNGRGRRRAGSPGNGGANNRRLEQSYFEALGLGSTATLGDVKTAYRDMVKHHHPDQGGSVQDFLRLQEAYEYLLTQVF